MHDLDDDDESIHITASPRGLERKICELKVRLPQHEEAEPQVMPHSRMRTDYTRSQPFITGLVLVRHNVEGGPSFLDVSTGSMLVEKGSAWNSSWRHGQSHLARTLWQTSGRQSIILAANAASSHIKDEAIRYELRYLAPA
jgi:hypothetical protein